MTEYASAIELKSVDVEGSEGLRCFSLSLRESTVVLCSLGASVLSWNHKDVGDIVLGYKNAEAMFRSKNPVYFSAIVGRVANRISLGKLTVGGKTHELEVNDPPNHLHGGGISGGFSHKNWNDAQIIDFRGGKAVQFSLLSTDGDQGYPGEVRVTATYSLRPSLSSTGVVLRLDMNAKLIGDKITPINLAQHSYFNLSGQEGPEGILDHRLSIDSDAYTPVDDTSIPTREVISLDEEPVMDWRNERNIRDALQSYGVEKVRLSPETTRDDLEHRKQSASHPYGFDHNYIVRKQPGTSIAKVASLNYMNRTLTVYSNAPGVQLYTANYLGESENSSVCKADYRPWSGICLETQHFPDSIILDPSKVNGEFANGACCLLTPKNPDYESVVEYSFESNDQSPLEIVGSDTDGRSFDNKEEMWRNQDLSSWYALAKDYYEENCSATIDGVLGGIGWISDIDLNGSKEFMSKIKLPKNETSKSVACECGAGIGRVTKGLLLDLCDRCDLVESNTRLLNAAPEYIGNNSYKCRFFSFELQDWEPPKEKYTVIWIQWVLCYLTDDDIVKFLRRCGESLVDGGIIVLKENTCTDKAFVVDVDDASVCRSLPYWLDLIFKAGLRVTHQTWQEDFPDDIFAVPLLALQPERNIL